MVGYFMTGKVLSGKNRWNFWKFMYYFQFHWFLSDQEIANFLFFWVFLLSVKEKGVLYQGLGSSTRNLSDSRNSLPGTGGPLPGTCLQGRNQLFILGVQLAERSDAGSHYPTGALGAARRGGSSYSWGRGHQPQAGSRCSAPVGSRGPSPRKIFLFLSILDARRA